MSDPIKAPMICEAMYTSPSVHLSLPYLLSIKPKVTAGFIWPPVKEPATTMARNRLSEMKMLEKTPMRSAGTNCVLRHTNTP